jgi:hypothetical protein
MQRRMPLLALLALSLLISVIQADSVQLRLDLEQKIKASLNQTLTQTHTLTEENIFDDIGNAFTSLGNGAASFFVNAANVIAQGFMSTIAGPVAGWTAGAFKDTKAWTTGAYASTEQDLNSFANDAQRGLSVCESSLVVAYQWSDKYVDTSINYLTSGGFENDLKRLGAIIEGALEEACAFPGAQPAMKAAVSELLKVAVCAATEMQGPQCKFPIPIDVLAIRALMDVMSKCAIYQVLDSFTGLCAGRNDYIADLFAAYATHMSVYDVLAEAIVECMCGGCPGTIGWGWAPNWPRASDSPRTATPAPDRSTCLAASQF